MTHDTHDIAAFIVELTKRTPAKDRTVQIFDVAVEREFPGVTLISFTPRTTSRRQR